MFVTRVWYFALRAHSGEIAGKIFVRFFSPIRAFLFSQKLLKRFWGQVIWHLWIGRAGNPGPSVRHVAVEVFDGDLALEAPVQMCSEWARLWSKGLASTWAPAFSRR